MKVKSIRGVYSDVPPKVIICFWGTTNLAITHGVPSQAVDSYYPAFNYYKEKFGNKRNKRAYIGRAIPYKHESGRIIVGLFDRVHEDEQPNEDSIKKCLISLRKGLIKSKKRILSMPPSRVGVVRTEKLVKEVFKDTNFGIVIKHF